MLSFCNDKYKRILKFLVCIRAGILAGVPKRVMKLNDNAENINRTRVAKVRSKMVCERLARHVIAGEFENPQKGFYGRK